MYVHRAARSRPVAGDGDASSVAQPETRHVQGTGARMLAPIARCAAIDAPAGVAAEMLDRDDARAQSSLRRRLDHFALPQDQPGR